MTDSWHQFRNELHREREPEPTSQASYQLCGSNVIGFAMHQNEKHFCLLGERYLTRRSGMFVVAPSGQGKSTAVMQAMVCWCCGRPAFEIHAPDPLRIDMIQAEDDDGDLADMARVTEYLSLSGAERE